MAATVGAMREISSYKSRFTNPVQNKDFGWHIDIEAACAEVALAKHLGVFWDGSVGTGKAIDVGKYQVRHTPRENGALIIRPRDSDFEQFVLVTGVAPDFIIRGWILGVDGKVQKYLRDPNGKFPAYFVPQSDLKAI